MAPCRHAVPEVQGFPLIPPLYVKINVGMEVTNVLAGDPVELLYLDGLLLLKELLDIG